MNESIPIHLRWIISGENRHIRLGGKFPSGLPICTMSTINTEENGKLIIDAGNTKYKCGLFPSQLLEQRNELLEALIHVKDTQKEFGTDSSGRMILRIEKEDWKLYLEAIKKATE